MAEKEEFLHLIVQWRSAVVLIPTSGLTVFEDLTSDIVTGCLITALAAGVDRWRQRGVN